ncbi:MAG: hypothetical protein V4649_19240 [Bacteroidota bacterium]
MKKLITTCALLTTVSVVSFAQSKQTSHTMSMEAQTAASATPANATPVASKSSQMTAERKAKMLQKQYGLNPAQYKGVYQAELEYAVQDEQIRQSGNEPGSGQAMQMGMGRDMKIKAAMTPEQYTKYETASKKN